MAWSTLYDSVQRALHSRAAVLDIAQPRALGDAASFCRVDALLQPKRTSADRHSLLRDFGSETRWPKNQHELDWKRDFGQRRERRLAQQLFGLGIDGHDPEAGRLEPRRHGVCGLARITTQTDDRNHREVAKYALCVIHGATSGLRGMARHGPSSLPAAPAAPPAPALTPGSMAPSPPAPAKSPLLPAASLGTGSPPMFPEPPTPLEDVPPTDADGPS